jgi:hypothetical protein
MAAATLASEFLNRNIEREHLDTLPADVRAGHSAALLLSKVTLAVQSQHVKSPNCDGQRPA